MGVFIEIKINEEMQRIEVHFIETPSKELSAYLKNLGYRANKETPLIYYVPIHPSYDVHAKTLKEVLSRGDDYKAIQIKPSHQPSDDHITFNNYSYVVLKFPASQKKKDEIYVVFEQHINMAKAIVSQYVNKKYAGLKVMQLVKAKAEKKAARTAFQTGNIIGSDTYVNALDLITPIDMPVAMPQVNKNSESEQLPTLKNKQGIYTKETAGDRFETLEIPIPKAAKYSASIRIVQDQEDQFRYGVSQRKEFGDATGNTSPISDIDTPYPTKEEAIKHGLREIVTTLKKFIEARDSIVSNQDQKNKKLQKALNAVLDFGVPYGIDLEVPDKITIEEEKTATTQTEETKETEEQQATSKTYTVKQSWSSVADKWIEKLEDYIEANPQYLHMEYAPSENEEPVKISGVKLVSDKDTLSFVLKNENELHLSAHNLKSENVNYGGSTMSKSKLTKAIKYLIKNPSSSVLPIKEITTTKESTPEDTTAKAVQKKEVEKEAVIVLPDLTPLPSYILIPKEVTPPFSTKKIHHKDTPWIKEHVKELYNITDETLASATSRQLFMLMQLGHPKEYGIAVQRSKLLEHYVSHGKELFETLGYPTTPDALYANLYVDYKSVKPLSAILGDNPKRPEWWYVAESHRPVHDFDSARAFLETQKKFFLDKREAYINPKTLKPKANTKDKQAYRELTWDAEDVQESIDLLTNAQKKQSPSPKEIVSITKKQEASVIPTEAPIPVKDYLFFTPETAVKIRAGIKENHLLVLFTGSQAWEADCTPQELYDRWGTAWEELQIRYREPIQAEIVSLRKSEEELKDKRTATAQNKLRAVKEKLRERNTILGTVVTLVHDEFLLFQDELFEVLLAQTKKLNYTLEPSAIKDFQQEIMPQLLEQRHFEFYAKEPIQRLFPKLLKWYFEDGEKPHSLPKRSPQDDERQCPDYMAKVIAYMSNSYIEAKHMTKKKVENLMEVTGTPNLGMLWEAVELSWLLWYKMYYDERIIFENRLAAMIRFWHKVQPTYAYSDSSKELYKQYSTPCPIGAMIAQYTGMDSAESIFEPSAGNGLLLVGAKPEKCHVNEIDKNRRQSLLQQGFAKVTHLNAAEPFPDEMTHSFDVVVTNPPFSKWEEDKFDKTVIIKKYFDKHHGLEHHIRLEHMMAGLALHTMKSSGKAAIIIMGHTYFDERGYIARYRPFFNWLYRTYRVADVININSYKMYNKQGAVKEVQLILIDGRRKKAKGAAPQYKDAPHLGDTENTFEELWYRIKSNIKSPLENLIQQLKIANGHDIF